MCTEYKDIRIIDENEKKYIIISENERYELDIGENYEIDTLLKWIESLKKLSKRKQKMRIPVLSAIRAVGLDDKDIDVFLNNEGKFGLVAHLRQKDWYKNTHPEIKSAVLKLCAHLGLYEDKMKNKRDEIINKVLSNYSLLEIHNHFGGLLPGTSLEKLNMTYDSIQEIDPQLRKKFDPKGEKAINFFLKNINNPNFKKISNYALTHYVLEEAKLDSLKQSKLAMIQSKAAKSSNEEIKKIANLINDMHNIINNYVNSNNTEINNNKIKNLQDKMESIRKKLFDAISNSNDVELIYLLNNYKKLPKNVTIEQIEKSLEETNFSEIDDIQFSKALIDAGYKNGDELEVSTLYKIYKLGKNKNEKYFELDTKDTKKDGYKYRWLKPDEPLLYTIAMKCGGTCMRPGFAGEAALWESALSPDIGICAIYNEKEQPIAYMRVNYEQSSKGLYIDTVESRKTIVLNNDEIWNTIKRAVIDMASAMNLKNIYPVDIITYREDLGNRLKNQWKSLPVSDVNVKARPYYYKDAPWTYGDYDERIQKLVWKKGDDKMNIIKSSLKDYEEIGRGANGIIYSLNNSQIIKVYPENYDIKKIDEEFNKAKIIYDSGIKSPKPFEITKIDDKIGFIMEKVKGTVLTKQIASNPSKLDSYMKEMVESIKKIHSIDAKNFNIQSVKEKYRNALINCGEYYSKEELDSLLKLLTSIPESTNLLHGDLHTGNIMVNENDELVIIDFLELGYGHPIFDVMAQGAVMPVTAKNKKALAEGYHQVSIDLLDKIWNSYISHYYNVDYSDKEFEEINKDVILYSRIRNAITKTIAENIPEEYLELCASETKKHLIPETDRLVHDDKLLKKTLMN